MTAERLALAELLEKAGDCDFLRAVAEAVLQLLMETDVEGLIGVARHERSPDRLNYRNGYRDRTLATRAASSSEQNSLTSCDRRTECAGCSCLLPRLGTGARMLLGDERPRSHQAGERHPAPLELPAMSENLFLATYGS